MARLLADPAEAERLGRNGEARAHDLFLSDRHLQQWAQVITRLG